jgi:hypothetical protein
MKKFPGQSGIKCKKKWNNVKKIITNEERELLEQERKRIIKENEKMVHLLTENDKKIFHEILSETLRRKEKEVEEMENILTVDEMIVIPPKSFVIKWWGKNFDKKMLKNWKTRIGGV